MNTVLTLIRPRLRALTGPGTDRRRRYRLVLFGGIGALFWFGIFGITWKVLVYFQGVEGFGDVLAYKLLSMVLLTFFALLIFSAILTSLSKLYLSRDLMLVHGFPVARETIFFARWLESTADSAWMVVVYTIPVLLSYGIVFHAGAIYYGTIALVLVAMCAIASALSALIVMIVVVVLPASRIRSIFIFLGLSVLIGLYITFRMLRPERLVDPESFATVMRYLQALDTPASPWLPTTWAFDALKAALNARAGELLFDLGLSWSCAGFLVFIDLVLARHFYFSGFSKAQAAMARLVTGSGSLLERLLVRAPGPMRAFFVKENKSFWRDQTQWSQLFLLAALIAIYLYNFSVLPLNRSPIPTVYLQNLFSFLNIALAAFVLTAITARFAFPSVSIEGDAFWIVRSAPIRIRTFLWIKFGFYLVPLMVMTQVLIVATNLLLHVTPFMMGLSVVTLLGVTPGVIALGIGLGAAYPNFTSENPSQVVTGFGGLLFMILSAAFIGAVVILESGPVYAIFMTGIKGVSMTAWQRLWLVASFSLVAGLCVVAVVWPMRYGIRKLALRDQEGADKIGWG